MNKSASIGAFLLLIKLKVTKINNKALFACGKGLFLRVTVVLMKVTNDLYGITILRVIPL